MVIFRLLIVGFLTGICLTHHIKVLDDNWAFFIIIAIFGFMNGFLLSCC